MFSPNITQVANGVPPATAAAVEQRSADGQVVVGVDSKRC